MNILTEEIPEGSVWYRIHRKEFGWKWFGPAAGSPPTNRFDAPNGEYGTCYFGNSLYAAFAETLLRSPKIRLLELGYLELLAVTRIQLSRSVVLARAHGTGLRRLEVSAEEMHGAHAICRKLSLGIWNHRMNVDGIAYRSRFDNDEICFALFDRAEGAIEHVDTQGLTDDATLLAEILTTYDVGLA